MSDDAFDQESWLARIGYRGSRAPALPTLEGVVSAQAAAIAYESIDVLLDRPPALDLASLQRKRSPAGAAGIVSNRTCFCAEACARSASA